MIKKLTILIKRESVIIQYKFLLYIVIYKFISYIYTQVSHIQHEYDKLDGKTISWASLIPK